MIIALPEEQKVCMVGVFTDTDQELAETGKTEDMAYPTMDIVLDGDEKRHYYLMTRDNYEKYIKDMIAFTKKHAKYLDELLISELDLNAGSVKIESAHDLLNSEVDIPSVERFYASPKKINVSVLDDNYMEALNNL